MTMIRMTTWESQDALRDTGELVLAEVHVGQVDEGLEVTRDVGQGPLGVPQVEGPQVRQGGQRPDLASGCQGSGVVMNDKDLPGSVTVDCLRG